MVDLVHIHKITTNFPHLDLALCPKTQSPSYNLDSSEQFLNVLCGGPWVPTRQNQVKKQVQEWYQAMHVNDLRELNLGEVIYTNPFPLQWQMSLLENVIATSQSSFYTFNEHVSKWRSDLNHKRATLDFFDFCGVKSSGTKITWVFVRDHLGFDGFPIDRWVRRGLKYFDLPTDSHYIIEACNQGNINVSQFNVGIKEFAKYKKLTN